MPVGVRGSVARPRGAGPASTRQCIGFIGVLSTPFVAFDGRVRQSAPRERVSGGKAGREPFGSAFAPRKGLPQPATKGRCLVKTLKSLGSRMLTRVIPAADASADTCSVENACI